ncbi:ATP-binding protein [Paenibacillus sp. PL91]|uniref:ATP-binding protein n=1 Tax=Paenibacillus sp. PL91 TaxID=2729538 RepID=UPI00145F9889|nr:ATP-binding protein [Paenibacillus sp. PL91]MBC9202747.1 PAS domain-containing protein [Paenibacillus sp. PL91]
MLNNDRIIESHKQCVKQGLSPDYLPVYTECCSGAELEAKRSQNREAIEVIGFFVDKFLSSVAGDPFFIAISDHEGYILEFKGDSSIIATVRQLGIVEGLRFSEEIGTNAVDLCIRSNGPIQLIGEDHFHKALHQLACYTTPIYNKDNGQLLATLSLMTGIQFNHPHLLALLCTIVDSIERELLLRRNNTQLQILNQVLLKTNYYGVVITDALGTIIDTNDIGAAILGKDKDWKDSCLGTSVFERSRIAPYFEQVISSREPCVGIEVALQVGNLQRYYMLDVVPIYDNEHQLTRVVGSLRDITEMKTTEELLRNTEKLVFAGQIAVSIAHEIRNPMTTVKGMLQLSSKTTNPHYYNLMMSELERMNAIVGEFLILGRPQAIQYKDEQCSILLQEVLSVFEMQLEMNGIQIHCDTQERKTIRCDRDQVKQVILNILKNAMEALPFGGEIRIQLDEVEGFQRMRFADNGVGMTDEVLQRIGQPFHTTRRDGNGLGMMIVDKIVSSHNGRLVISSELEVGTTVEVWFPCV